MDEVETVVIGAGVVGLAIARRLAMAGQDVILLEKADLIGSETSSRNSEVIHAGIYYPTGSLKAQLCVAGRNLLYRYCAAHDVAHRRLGKLIVASETAQEPELAKIASLAQANGVIDLRPLSTADIAQLEPAIRGTAGLFSPSTGIVDSHGLMLALRGDIEVAGGMIAFHATVKDGRITDHGHELTVDGETPMRLRARRVINATGHGAWEIARNLAGYPADLIPPQAWARGCYFTLQGKTPFTHLVYPVPEPGGLGIHLTLDLAGRARFGPDVEWIDGLDYHLDPARVTRFYPAIRHYWPDLPDEALSPAYTGIRPKLGRPAGGFADFRIDGPTLHGVQGLVQLFGIESPGLTASLAIADLVAEQLGV